MDNVLSKTAKVSPKGQVAIPADIRKKLRINSGDKLIFNVNEDNQLTVEKMTTENEWQDILSNIPIEKIVLDKAGKVDAIKNPEFADWLDGEDDDY